MNKAYPKDIVRSVRKGWKRFVSILIITALGVGMLTGLYAASMDMYDSADRYFDQQDLFDIRILSTLGLTHEDVQVLGRVEGIRLAEGAYNETVYVWVGELRKSADMTTLSEKGINQPYLLEGRLPQASGEIAVSPQYIKDNGKTIGDLVTIQKDKEEESLQNTALPEATQDQAASPLEDEDELDVEWEEEEEDTGFIPSVYKIVGVAADPRDISGDGHVNEFRATATTDYTFFASAQDVDSKVFTAVYILLEETKALNSYSEAYKNAVSAVVGDIEAYIKAQREEARFRAVMQEARTKLADAQATMNEKFAEADQKLADAWQEIMDARLELADGEATLSKEEREAKEKLEEARAELEDARLELEEALDEFLEGKVKLADGESELNQNASRIRAGKEKLAQERKQAEEQFVQAEQQFAQAQSQLDASRLQLKEAVAQMQGMLGEGWPAREWDALVDAAAAMSAAGKDDAAIQQATAAQRAALAGVLQNRADAIYGMLQQQISQAQGQLDGVHQAASLLQQQLDTALGQATEAQTVLTEKQLDLQAAQEELHRQQQVLSGLEEGTAQYQTQLEVVAQAQLAQQAAQTAVGDARQALEDAQAAIQEGNRQLEETTRQAGQLTSALSQLRIHAAQVQALPQSGVQAGLGLGKLEGGQQLLNAQQAAFAQQKQAAYQQFAQAEAQLAAGEAEIASARDMIEARKEDMREGKAELDKGRKEFAEGEATFQEEEADAKRKLAEAWQEITDGRKELADGIAELTEKEQEYAVKKEEAQQKLADAYAELQDIDMTRWYVQDRTSLDSYSSLSSDLSSIEAVGKIFPLIFLLVAVLMSLTAMTRMVEEERGLIGTYKALGFSNGAIYRKYLLFAFMACLAGGILGDVIGFVLMPKFIIFILEQELYSIPQYFLRFDALYGIGGVLLFMLGIVGSTALACRSELAQMPAALMRPKAPRAGSRVFLERIPAVWQRLKFLNKVTVRNLFRYKKRLFMTVGGIAGCMALIICGFAIKDSINSLGPKQYEHIYRYDLLTVVLGEDNDSFIAQLAADDRVTDYLNLRVESVKVLNGSGKSEKVQLMVVSDATALESYIRLQDPQGRPVHLTGAGVFLTQNAAELLGLAAGDTLSVQNMDLVQQDTTVAAVAQNYLGNTIYMTRALYESLFGEYLPNGVVARLSKDCDQVAYAETLLDDDRVLSSVSVQGLRESFGFDLIDSVVLLITVMAGGLAFVVLFTLSNTNISERQRELATIKVLGFYDAEVHQYVNKETLLLTFTGILAGLPLGRFISGLLTTALKMPSIYFAVHIQPVSYLIAAALTFVFALLVNCMTNRSLNRINMVEALKSVE